MIIGFKNSGKEFKNDVKRGILPILLTNVEIRTDLIDEYDFPVQGNVQMKYSFNIVPDETVGASDNFIIKNFQIGRVSFIARGITSSRLSDYNSTARDHTILAEDTDVATAFNKYDVMNPLITYSGSVIKNTTAGDNNSIEVNLTPNTGRVISIFNLSDELKALNYTAEIAGVSGGGSATLNKDNCVVLHLCGNQVNGNIELASVNIVVSDESGEIVYAYRIDQTAVRGESVNVIYTITSNNFPSANHLQSTIFVPEFESEAPIDAEI